jgi:hypothetical protein
MTKDHGKGSRKNRSALKSNHTSFTTIDTEIRDVDLEKENKGNNILHFSHEEWSNSSSKNSGSTTAQVWIPEPDFGYKREFSGSTSFLLESFQWWL